MKLKQIDIDQVQDIAEAMEFGEITVELRQGRMRKIRTTTSQLCESEMKDQSKQVSVKDCDRYNRKC